MAEFWKALEAYRDRRILPVLLLGFSSGLPLLLVISTLSARLHDGGIDRATIGLFAYVLAPYTFKFAWAPLVDRLVIPVLGPWLGQRRSWMLVAQLALIASLVWLASVDAATDPWGIALAALAVSFSSATQDIVIDAWRVEILPEERLAAGSSVHVIGYRIGMWVARGGALLLADLHGWHWSYLVMAALVLIGLVTTFFAPEPEGGPAEPPSDGTLASWLERAVLAPFRDFIGRRGLAVALVILAFISLYKACDVLLTLMADPFYLDIGFTKTDIAQVSGTFGLFVGLLGGVLGGLVAFRMGILRALFLAGILQGGSNLAFAWLAMLGPSKLAFFLVILVENLSSGIGTAVFVAYLSSLCSRHYTATQYALLTSFMQLFGKFVIVPSSGFLADGLGWTWFFIGSALLALPGLVLLAWLQRRVGIEEPAPGTAAVRSG